MKKFDTEGLWFNPRVNIWSGDRRNTKQKWLPHLRYVQWNFDELFRGADEDSYT